MKIEIKSRWNGSILFAHEAEENSLAITLAMALKACADLYGADLRGANLRGANLGGAYLRGEKLVCDRPFMQVGPIGSRNDYLLSFITDHGVMLRAGCFFGTRDEFETKLNAEHGSNEHAQEYRAALVLIDKHAELWTPKEEEKVVA